MYECHCVFLAYARWVHFAIFSSKQKNKKESQQTKHGPMLIPLNSAHQEHWVPWSHPVVVAMAQALPYI